MNYSIVINKMRKNYNKNVYNNLKVNKNPKMLKILIIKLFKIFWSKINSNFLT